METISRYSQVNYLHDGVSLARPEDGGVPLCSSGDHDAGGSSFPPEFPDPLVGVGGAVAVVAGAAVGYHRDPVIDCLHHPLERGQSDGSF